ncbi:MAG TPA: hypothetical protein VG267_11605 [Terracidiphilus sp.]|jgi:hypothetical protein|nr:hypothetical protein [Terracidiphilus sp.]
MVSRPTIPTPGFGPQLEPALRSDRRWQLVERILLTGPFQKSANLHTLLRYLAEHSIRNESPFLAERQVGIAVFGKADDYSPAEDSAVRVHVRQLRLRLHEYFAVEGRHEELIADIPKGSYLVEFHPAEADARPAPAPVAVLAPAPVRSASRRIQIRDLLLLLVTSAAVFFGIAWYRAAHRSNDQPVPWPVSAVIQPGQDTHIVVSDGNSMVRLLANHEITLEEYLQPGFRSSLIPKRADAGMSRLLNYIANSQLTSLADLAATSSLMRLAPEHAHVMVTSASALNERELEDGNFVFLGSPTSNPWVSLFADQLNFQVVEDGVGGRMYFRNKKPLPGEQATYEGLSQTGSAGEDYGTISLLATGDGRGQVLILQGLRQEGTEALAELLSDPDKRLQLMRALAIDGDPKTPDYFEALVGTHAVAGAPVSFSIVATRKISPSGQSR